MKLRMAPGQVYKEYLIKQKRLKASPRTPPPSSSLLPDSQYPIGKSSREEGGRSELDAAQALLPFPPNKLRNSHSAKKKEKQELTILCLGRGSQRVRNGHLEQEF